MQEAKQATYPLGQLVQILDAKRPSRPLVGAECVDKDRCSVTCDAFEQ